MAWLKRNYLVLVVLGAIVLSFVVNRNDSVNDDRRQMNADIAACLRTTERAALDAGFKYDAAEARRKDGNDTTADKYAAIADQVIRSLPFDGAFEGKQAMAEIRYFRDSFGRLHAELTYSAQKLQKSACVAVFS